jgi:hypothetical protein
MKGERGEKIASEETFEANTGWFMRLKEKNQSL